jgi:hypothetical protein
MALAAPKWDKDDVQWVQRRLMPYFGIKALKLAIDDSGKKWPDIWVILGNPPKIVVTKEWASHDTHLRRSQLVHEALHAARGLEHGVQPNGMDFNTRPEKDAYSKAVYQAMLRGDRWARNPEGFRSDKTGMPYYDQLLKLPDYYRTNKGVTGRIVMMTPMDYMQRVANMHRSTPEREEISLSQKHLAEYTKMIKEGTEFEMPVLDYAYGSRGTQEGRHRAIAARDAGITKIPVLIVEKAIPSDFGTSPNAQYYVGKDNPLNPKLLFSKKKEAYFSPDKYAYGKKKQRLFGDSAIVIGKYPQYPEFEKGKPMVIAHEVGHFKTYEPTLAPKHAEQLREAKAWMWALQKLQPKEINLKVLALSLVSHHMPVDIHDAIMTYAKARKEGRDNPLFIGWTGPAWRVATGYHHDRRQKAADVLRFEEKELGNRYNIPLKIRRMLRDRPAGQMLWVTRSRKAAERYGTPENVTSDVQGARIIAEDGDDGYLVLLSHEVRL